MEIDFEKNMIIKHLKDKNSPFLETIKKTYEICDNILCEIPKVFSNYTLHDINHSIRVIDYMTLLLKKELNNYSDLHLAMIIFSGLFHDTGMFVSDDEYSELVENLSQTNPDFKGLSNKEKNFSVQEYVRENHGERVSNLLKQEYVNNATISSLFYVGSYNYAELLALICQSHCESSEWIESNLKVDERIAVYKINPQHIAFLLRIADALDIDDRRAPWVLYKLLSPKGKSDDEWRKHIPITNYEKISLEAGRHRISFFGKCDDYKIYREIQNYIGWINEELDRINRITYRFNEEYKMEFEIPISDQIEPKGFLPINLRFSLNYIQIADLLMGENIYGNKKNGMREVLQNAIDAVLLMQAIFEKQGNPFYQPIVSIELNKAKNQIVVYDNGTGMSFDILTKYFFSIGNSYYVSREFKNNRFAYKPIGHYGIGFLACFMLSNKVVLETKYYTSSEVHVIELEKSSPYANFIDNNMSFFGEHGTRITFDYSQIIGDVFSDENDLIKYVTDTLLPERYSLQILQNGVVTPIKSSFFSGNADIIRNEDMDISFKLKEFPDIITTYSQINKYAEHSFYYYSSEDGVDTDFVNLEELLYLNLDSSALFHLNDTINKMQVNDLQTDDVFATPEDEILFLQIFPILEDEDLLKLSNQDVDFVDLINGRILKNAYKNDTISWLDVPYLPPNLIENFLYCVDNESYTSAMQKYAESIRYISVFGVDNLSSSECLEVVNIISDLEEWDYVYIEYPFKVIPRRVEVIKHPDMDLYMRILKKYDLAKKQVKHKIYMKGIWVHDEKLVLPNVIAGTKFEDITVNIKSDKYAINVARNKLKEDSQEKLQTEVVKAIYSEFFENIPQIYTPSEAFLIKSFLKKYFGCK